MGKIGQTELKFHLLKQSYNEKFRYYTPPDLELIEKEKEIIEGSFYEFVKLCWQEIEGSDFIPNWHLEALCDHLEAVYYNKINYLIINMPPRVGKSLILSVFFPTWCWIKDSKLKLMFTSYSEQLAQEHHIKNRDLLDSDWFKFRYKDRIKIRKDIDNLTRFVNEDGGSRMISTVGGKSTGFGAHILITDDPNKAGDVESPIKRGNTNFWWSRSMVSRWAKASTFRRIICQQRLHEKDLTGFVLAQENPNLVHLYLPMEFESESRCVTVPLKDNKKKWKDPRRYDGELLCPKLIDAVQVKQLKKEMDEYTIAGQLQQRPAPIKGGFIKEEWFMKWIDEEPPECEYVLQSWDTALSNTASYSACTTWGIFKDIHGAANIILLDMWKGKLDYPDLRVLIKRLANNYHDKYLEDEPMEGPAPTQIIMENKASGIPIIKDLRRAGIFITPFNPTHYGDYEVKKNEGAKVARALLVTPLIESGRVWLPVKQHDYNQWLDYADEFVNACVSFPSPSSNDVIDSMSQAFIKIQKNKYVQVLDDPVEENQINIKNRNKIY